MANFLGYNDQLWKEIHKFTYTGQPQEFTLTAGTYLLICKGAVGGKGLTDTRAMGGMSCGILTLNESQKMYAYVGGDGEDCTPDVKATEPKGGWNGGGDGGIGYSTYINGAGGGGGTDIRLKRYEDCSGEEVEIPDGYQQIEYVETDGTQYINLGNLVQSNFQSVIFTRPVIMQLDYYCNENSVIEFDCALPAPVNAYDTPWGSRGNVDHFIAYNGGTLRYAWAGANANVGSISAYYGKRIKITLSRTYCKVETAEGDIIYNVSLNGGTATSTVPIGIGSLFTNASGGDYGDCRTNVTVYGMRIYENDVMAKEYIPFKDTSDVYCIKETISDNLFYPLHGDLTANIETNSVAFGFRTAVADTNDNMVIVGSRHDETAGNRFDIHLKKLNNELMINSVYGNQTDVDGDYVATGVNFNTSGRFLVTSYNVYINDTQVVQTSTSGESGTNPFYLFACYQEDTYTGVDPSTYFHGKLYHLKIYDVKTENDYNVTDDCPYYFDTRVSCTLNDRVFTKRSFGPAFGCVYRAADWTDLMFISKNSDDVIVDVPGYVKQPIAFTYRGETWYFSSSGYTFPGSYDDSSGNLPTFPTSFANLDDPTNAITILDYIYENWGMSKSFNDPLKLFVPCIRNSDHAIGLLDVKNGDFYQSETTPLIAGPIGTFQIQDDIINEDVIRHRTLNTRIIVAGGGGGGCMYTYTAHPDYASFGGGVNGGPIIVNGTGAGMSRANAYATQTDGFAFGMSGKPKTKTTLVTNGAEGASGGGGGWYGGYVIDETVQYSSGPGGGGSGYVLTSTSIKPTGYSVPSSLQMTHPLLLSNKSTDASVEVYQLSGTSELDAGDVIKFFQTGVPTQLTLDPGQYTLKCWGADGGVRELFATAARGGYAEGTINLPSQELVEVFVGGSGIGDNLISSAYTNQCFPELSVNGGGAPSAVGSTANGDGRSGGGASDIRIITGLGQNDDSLYARVIVAGGAGGQSSGNGGVGGGETGGNPTGSAGQNAGPGTQTGSPQSETLLTTGGFGYGGSSDTTGTYAGGAGGSGWYGGSGTIPASSDANKGGAGGSGYVLTINSYKPTGYLLDEQYYLTDTTLTAGGNNLPIGVSQVEIDVIAINTALILCRDADGVKYYNAGLSRWVFLANELTDDLFVSYGVQLFPNDTGLLDEYEVLVYDTEDGASAVAMTFVPNTQHIVCDDLTGQTIDRIVPDFEYDPSIYDVDYEVTREPRGSLTKIHTDISITKKQISDKIAKIYSITYFTK